MNTSFLFKILIPLILLFLVFGLVYYQRFVSKELRLIWPNGKEILRAGNTYKITWEARKIDKIDIILVKEEEPKKSKVIVEDFPAKNKEYLWQVFVFEEPGERYKISIFESPWQEGNKIDYSDDYFTILGPKFASCEQLLVKNNWPFIPSDYPNLRKVFITRENYAGNLGGLEGADKICQEEAKKKELEGNWRAFLGDDNISATERLNLEGIFVDAESGEALPQEKLPAYFWESFGDYLNATSSKNEDLRKKLTSAYESLNVYFAGFYQKWNLGQEKKSCFRFLASDFQKFFKRLSSPYLLIKGESENEFLNNFFGKEIWLGRINPEDKKSCINIFSQYSYIDTSSTYSFTPTCQNWMTNKDKIETSLTQEKEVGGFPQCYTVQGVRINALGIAGVARIVLEKEDKKLIDLSLGKSCKEGLKLLCVEQ